MIPEAIAVTTRSKRQSVNEKTHVSTNARLLVSSNTSVIENTKTRGGGYKQGKTQSSQTQLKYSSGAGFETLLSMLPLL